MLLLTSVALIIQGLFHFLRPAEVMIDEAAISLAIAALLMVVYVLSLVFSLLGSPGYSAPCCAPSELIRRSRPWHPASTLWSRCWP